MKFFKGLLSLVLLFLRVLEKLWDFLILFYKALIFLSPSAYLQVFSRHEHIYRIRITALTFANFEVQEYLQTDRDSKIRCSAVDVGTVRCWRF